MFRVALIALFIAKPALGQEFVFNFLRNDFKKYLFTNLKLHPNHSHLDYMLYDSLHHCKQLVGVNVAEPMTNIPYRTNPKRFLDRVFSVEHIYNENESENRTASRYPIFLLRDVHSGDTIYFKYNPDYSNKFPFVVDGITAEEDDYCHLIEHKQLPVASINYLHTPSRGSVDATPVSLHKYKNGSKENYTLHLRTYGTRPHARVKGVTVYLDDGSRIVRNDAVIRFTQNATHYEYSASIKLTDADLEKLQSTTIAKHELYIYKKEVDKTFANRLRLLAKCMAKIE